MKKTAYILAAVMLIATLAGCDGNSGDSQTTNKDGKVTQVAFQTPEEPDTTDQAVAYLKTQVPLFAKYLETRMQYPLTYETEVQTAEGTMKAAIYIKSASEICFSSTNTKGYTTRTIYAGKKVYSIIDEERIIYEGDTTKEAVKEVVENNLLKIDYNEASSMTYETSETPDYYNDVLYKHEIIYSEPSKGVHYYYDVNTDDLVYVVVKDSVTKVTRLDNEVSEDPFSLPMSYETKSLEEYFAEQAAEQAAAQASE